MAGGAAADDAARAGACLSRDGSSFERADVAAAYGAAKRLGLYRGVGYALAGPGETRDA